MPQPTRDAMKEGNKTQTIAAFEFDCLQEKMRVEVRDDEGETSLVVCGDDDEFRILTAYPDQWGTWIAIGDKTTIAQEDCTRSFVEALISGLKAFKDRTDFDTLAPTTLTTPHRP